MHVNDLNFDLPKELIAQFPSQKRDECRLLAYSRNSNNIKHLLFKEVSQYINKDDILIFNNTKVFAARLYGKKISTGAKIEVLLLEKQDKRQWKALIKPAKRIKGDVEIDLGDNIVIKTLKDLEEGRFIIEFNKEMNFEDINNIGEIPLPPYINRKTKKDLDDRYYQTVYAKEYGAVAAPTAGFHFTDELLDELKKKGVRIGYITLHISYATFAPIRTGNIDDHQMHSEYLIVPEETADLVNNNDKGRVIAVGTTVVRALESSAVSKKRIQKFEGMINTFIKPGYEFKIIDSLITNFHLPKSTLLLLVSAFISWDKLKTVYKEAIDEKYRFFSYGDAMMIS